jgi:hypothetical protein
MDSWSSVLSPKILYFYYLPVSSLANAFEEWSQVSQPLSFGSGMHPHPDGISAPSAAWNAVETEIAWQ